MPPALPWLDKIHNFLLNLKFCEVPYYKPLYYLANFSISTKVKILMVDQFSGRSNSANPNFRTIDYSVHWLMYCLTMVL